MSNFVSKELVEKAKKIDLLTYFMSNYPNELVKKGIGTYSLKSHDSVMISNGLWHRFSTNEGGKTAVDYLMKVENMNFQDAVRNVLNNEITYELEPRIKAKEVKKIVIPEKADTNKAIISYLKSRGIDEEIIKECISKRIIYQEKGTNNVVFVGLDEYGNIKYAGCRSTGNNRIMRDVKGSSKEFSFRLLSNTDNKTLHIFESSIDLLSYATILKLKGYEYKNHNLLALAGVYQPSSNIEQNTIPIAIKNYLKKYTQTENIVLHLDNDRAGRIATKALMKALNKYNVYDIPVPYGKDINEYLCLQLKLNKKQKIERYKDKNTYKMIK